MGKEPRVRKHDNERQLRLERLLDFEITRAQNASVSSGWTTWALLVGLGTVLWLASEEIYSGRALLRESLGYWSATMATWSFMVVASRGLRRLAGAKPKDVRFLASTANVSAVVPIVAVHCLRAVSIAFAARWAGLAASAFEQIVVFSSALGGVIALVLATAAVFVRAPMPLNGVNDHIVARAMLIGRFLATGTTAFVLIHAVLGGRLSDNWISLRCGVLLAVGAWVLMQLVEHMTPGILGSSLVALRRKIGLGEISYDPAARLFKMDVEGCHAPDVVQQQATTAFEQAREAGDALSSALEELRAISVDVSGSHPLRDAALQSARAKLAHAQELLRASAGSAQRVHNEIALLNSYGPIVVAQLKQFSETFEIAVRQDQKRCERKRDRVERVIARLTSPQ